MTSKLFEVAIVVLFVATVSTALYGGVVPEYRSAVGAELSERTLTEAGNAIERTVPPAGVTGESERRVELPETIRGDGYRLRLDGRTLRLEHPARGIGGTRQLSIPEDVRIEADGWRSDRETVVTITRTEAGVWVALENR